MYSIDDILLLVPKPVADYVRVAAAHEHAGSEKEPAKRRVWKMSRSGMHVGLGQFDLGFAHDAGVVKLTPGELATVQHFYRKGVGARAVAVVTSKYKHVLDTAEAQAAMFTAYYRKAVRRLQKEGFTASPWNVYVVHNQGLYAPRANLLRIPGQSKAITGKGVV